MHEIFIKNANIRLNESLLKTEALFSANKRIWFGDFAVHFVDICAKLKKWQTEGSISAISYLEYTMLYTNIINRRCIAEVFVYDEKCYLDKNQRFVGEYDISFIFVYFCELWDKLLSERKRYVGKVASHEVTAFMLKAVSKFFSYLTNIARFAIVDLTNTPLFADIEKSAEFMMIVGQYMTGIEPIYVECKAKNTKKLVDWFHEQLYGKYIFGDYSFLDFSGKVFVNSDFRYARFQNAVLINSSFDSCMLIGANFRNSNMQGCRLENCSLYESDFSYATLINSSFCGSQARAGLLDDKEWWSVGFLPVSFRCADLTNANFAGANLTGADFTGATLDGADFTGATLDGAVFN